MAKGKSSKTVKPLDEGGVTDEPLIRLTKDRVEGVRPSPSARVAEKPIPEVKLEAASKAQLRTRSKEPEMEELLDHTAANFEDDWSQTKPRATPWGWMIVLALILGAGILWSVVKVRKAEPQRAVIMEEAAELIEDEEQVTSYATTVVENLEESVRSFHEADRIEDLLRYVRHPERVEPLIRETYRESPPIGRKVTEFRGFDTIELQGRSNFWVVSSLLNNEEVEAVVVEIMEDQTARVDWETATRYQPMEWSKFVRDKPRGFVGEFRIFLEEPSLPTEAFEGRDNYFAVKLTDYEKSMDTYGYVKMGTEEMRKINDMLRFSGGAAYPAILRLGTSEVTGQTEVLKVVQAQWLYVTDPSLPDQ